MSRIAAITLVAALATMTGCDSLSQVFTHTTRNTARIQEVHVDLDSGSVQVTGGGTGQVKSAAVAQWYGEKPIVDFIEEGTLLRVAVACGRADTCQVDLSLEMPPEAKLFVNGEATDVMVTSVAGPAKIDTATGDIELTGCSGRLDLGVEDGRITGKALTSPHTVAEATNGAIALDYAAIPASVWAETTRGDISMTVPWDRYVVEAKSDDGRVDIRVPQAPSGTHALHAIAHYAGDISIRAHEIVYVPN